MNIFRKKNKGLAIRTARQKEQDEFDAGLVHVGGDIPQELKEELFDKHFIPMLKDALKYAGPEWDGRDYTSIARIEANGEMHTRVILLNNGGGAEEAVDVDGAMGDLLYLICTRGGRE